MGARLRDGSEAGRRYALSMRFEDLVADALRMNADLQSSPHIDVEQDIAPLPDLPLDRHRTLQVLVNLISNAKQALEAPEAAGKLLRIRAWRQQEGALWLSVEDQGDGIAPENLAKIFAHGFTTREHGHGFGRDRFIHVYGFSSSVKVDHTPSA